MLTLKQCLGCTLFQFYLKQTAVAYIKALTDNGETLTDNFKALTGNV